MALQGYEFTFDGIHSRKYKAIIAGFDNVDWKHTGGSAIELTTARTYRQQRDTLLGVIYPAMTFDLELLFTEPLNEYELSNCKTWLFSPSTSGYKKLCVLKNELQGVYFNCLLNQKEDYEIDGYNGVSMEVICDSGGAWRNSKTYDLTYTGNSATKTIVNRSAANGYTLPTVEIKFSGTGGFSIKNKSDNDRIFSFSTVNGITMNDGETVTVDCQNEIITSSVATAHRLENFNKKFLRLKRGVNTLECTGAVQSLKISYPDFVRLGG